jgi:endonuclease
LPARRSAVPVIRFPWSALDIVGSTVAAAGAPPGLRGAALELAVVRLVIARCSLTYAGRLTARLAPALRLLIVKADGSVLVHSDGGSYKPLNWMSPPCRLAERPDRWLVTAKSGDTLTIEIEEILSDSSFALGDEPGLRKDGVESELQELLATQLRVLGEGWQLVQREYPTAIGPVDLMCRDVSGAGVVIDANLGGENDGSGSNLGTAARQAVHVAVEVKRHAGIDAVEQLTRYLELLNRDPLLAPVHGVLAAQTIKPQARTLAEDRGIRCVVLDYDAMRGIEREGTLF